VATTLTAQLALIALVAVVAPVLAELSGPLAIPGVVLEIVLGLLIGPHVLDWVNPSGVVQDFSSMGLSMLMFLAGVELEIPVLRGRPLRLAGYSWLLSLCGAAVVGLVVVATGQRHSATIVALALSTTALTTLLPIMRDSGVLKTPLGHHLLAVGGIGELGPLVLIALLLSAENPGITTLVLIGFAAVAVGAAMLAHRPVGRRVTALIRKGLHSSSQLPVRASLALIVGFVFLAGHIGLDVLLGAFAAGVIVQVAVADRDDKERTALFRGKVEAIGFGFLVPIFFVVSGMSLNLAAVFAKPSYIALIPLYLLLLMLLRGAPILWVYRDELARPERLSLAMLSSTGLPLIVVITTIGLSDGYISTANAAALVTAGMLSVLIFPGTVNRRLRRGYLAESVSPGGP
jgi:Kef-type K+ transport system membrane component KefB